MVLVAPVIPQLLRGRVGGLQVDPLRQRLALAPDLVRQTRVQDQEEDRPRAGKESPGRGIPPSVGYSPEPDAAKWRGLEGVVAR